MQWHRMDDPDHPPPKDGTPIALAGGKIDWAHWEDCTRPVIAHWSSEGWYEGGGEWVVTYFDSKAATISYEDPTHWARIEPPKE